MPAGAAGFSGTNSMSSPPPRRTSCESAGGWLCDRARAGWDVNVLVADGGDPRPLTILGATALDLDDGFLSMVRSASRVGALAVSADLLGADTRVRDEVLRVLKHGLTEVTVWGRAVAGRTRSSGRLGPAPGELGRTGFQVARACRRRCFDGCGHTDRDAFPDRDRIVPPAVLRLNRVRYLIQPRRRSHQSRATAMTMRTANAIRNPSSTWPTWLPCIINSRNARRQQPADVDQPVVLLRPAPLRGRHIFDVDAGVSFHLGVGHGCSSRSG